MIHLLLKEMSLWLLKVCVYKALIICSIINDQYCEMNLAVSGVHFLSSSMSIVIDDEQVEHLSTLVPIASSSMINTSGKCHCFYVISFHMPLS